MQPHERSDDLLADTKSPLARVATVFVRKGCHLCTEATQLLAARGFSIQDVDIDADADLKAQCDQCVPVVEIAGKVRFRGRVNPVLLDRLVVAMAEGSLD